MLIKIMIKFGRNEEATEKTLASGNKLSERLKEGRF